jgi:hypothetical protein
MKLVLGQSHWRVLPLAARSKPNGAATPVSIDEQS